MQPPRRHRQEGLIREALYVFLGIAIVMAVLLDGVAIFTVQQDARDDAADAASEARQEYVETGSVDQARAAAARHVEANDAEMLGFTAARPAGGSAVQFTVTVQHHSDTYVFRYLEYVPGLDEWVEDVQNPSITRSTE